MLWMHISVTVALLVFLGTIPADIDTIRLAHGAYFPHPAAVEEKGALSPPLPYLRPLLRPLLHRRPPQPSRLNCISPMTDHQTKSEIASS